MNTNPSWSAAVLAQTTADFEPWLSCDDCFDRADAVVEDLLDDSAGLPPDFRAHLAGCGACREEVETLAELAAADRGLTAADGRARLDGQLAAG